MSSITCIGVDVASKKFDVAANVPLKRQSFTNSDAGIAQFVTECSESKPDLIVIESTGGYEMPLVKALHSVSIAVAVINPRRARHFARASGIEGKTDGIDASVLLQFGLKMCPEPTPKSDPIVDEIDELRVRQRQLTDILAQEKNRLETAPERNRGGIKRHIDWLKKEIETLNAQITSSIAKSQTLQNQYDLLCTTPGVGSHTAIALIGGLPELGTIDHKRIASLAGVAPFTHDSGTLKGKRFIKGGRTDIRTALYMAALSASRHNPVIKAYYIKLLERGKAKKVALVACMRKLLIILNAMIRDEQKWCPDPTGA